MKKLSTWEAACIITGYGIGSGVMSMPYLAQRIGIINASVILLLAFAASCVLHLMIAELSLKTEDGGQIISCLNRFLFKGKYKKYLSASFFILMLLVLLTNLTGYITASAEIITGFLGMPEIVSMFIFYAAACIVVLFGLKAVGVSEKYCIFAIYLLLGVLGYFSLKKKFNPLPLLNIDVKGILAYYGMAMFSLSAFFSVPQAARGLGGDRKEIRKAIFIGFLNNLIMIAVINVCSLLVSPEVTEVAMTGWSAGLGVWAQIVGGLFTILAMLSTYWSLSLALSDTVREALSVGKKQAWVIATFPSLVIAIVNPYGFLGLMRTAGGLVSIIIAVMIVPAFMNARKTEGVSMLDNNGNAVCAAVIIAYILMGVGSAVPL